MGRLSWLRVFGFVAVCQAGGLFGCSDDGASGPVTSLCARAEQKLRGCGLLSEGVWRCTEPSTAVRKCRAECDLQANCNQVRELVCGGLAEPIERCKATCEEFRCKDDGTPVSLYYVCDGQADCADGSDEQGCKTFTCADGEVVHEEARCNDYAECYDGSDERGCPVFTCSDGTTIGASNRCDGYAACYDGSDERDCPGFVPCRSGGESIPPSAKCDGYTDCSDGSDELGCPTEAEIQCGPS